SGAEAQGLAPGVETIDLIAFDATDLQPETVRPEIDDSQRGRRQRYQGGVRTPRSLAEKKRCFCYASALSRAGLPACRSIISSGSSRPRSTTWPSSRRSTLRPRSPRVWATACC